MLDMCGDDSHINQFVRPWLRIIASGNSSNAKAFLVTNQETPSNIIDMLCADSETYIRVRAARHSAASIDALLKLTTDNNRSVRNNAIDNICRQLEKRRENAQS